MKRLLALMILCSLALVVHTKAQTRVDIPLRRNLEMWFTSAPGAHDLIDMLTEYDNPRFQWANSRRYLHGIKFYQGQVQDHLTPFPMIGNNIYLNLKQRNVFWIIKNRFRKEVALEVGVIKHHRCISTNQELENVVDQTVEVGVRIYKMGGVLNYFDIDNSFASGCNHDYIRAAYTAAHWSMLVENRLREKVELLAQTDPSIVYEPIRFRDIEAYPYIPIQEHQRYANMLNIERTSRGYKPFDAYYLDIDEGIVKDVDLVNAVSSMASHLHANGIKLGVIINGKEPTKSSEDNDLFYLTSSNDRLVRFKNLGILDKIDILMVQSWAVRYQRSESELRDLPLNVPEDAITFTNFLWHTMQCIANVKDCQIYP